MLHTSAALVAGIAVALGVHAFGRRRPGLLHRPHRGFTWAVIALAVVAGAFAPVSPTGIEGVDIAYRALFAGAFTFAAGRARRSARIIGGAAAAIGSVGGWPWNVVAFVALGLATGSSRVGRPARPFGVVVGGLQAQVLLRLTWPDTSYATAALAALAFVVVAVSGFRHARSRERRVARVGLVALGAAAVVISTLMVVGLLRTQADLREGARAAAAGLSAARGGETEVAVAQLELAATRLSSADDTLGSPWMRGGRLLPAVGRYLDGGQRLTAAGTSVVDPALESARRSASDALQVRNGRIDLAAVAGLRPPLAATLSAVPEAQAAVGQLDGEALPGRISRHFDDLDRALASATEDGALLLDVLDLVPPLLGGDGPRRYFVVMQTPSEQRASGGIAGAFGELLVDDGSFELVRAGSGGELNQPGVRWDLGPVAADYARFDGFGPDLYFSNVTNVPHFPTVARAIAEIYPQAGGSPVDGVISVDPRVLAALLSLTGPVDVPGWPAPISGQNAERVLLFDQYQELPGPEGTQFVTDTIQATFDRLETATLPAPAQVLNTLSPMVQGERIKLYSARPEEQALFEEMGVTGALPEVEGDFFQVVTQNVGQSKIDWFQQRSVSYDVQHDPVTGRVDAVATVTITNEAPASGLSELVVGGPNIPEPGGLGRSRLFIDFWTALELEAATLDGVQIDLMPDQGFGHNLFWTVHTLEPAESATYELYLSGLLEPGAPYVLDLGVQPVVRPDRVDVRVRARRGADLVAVEGLEPGDDGASATFVQGERRRFVAGSRP